MLNWCIHDFDPLRVRKVQLERAAIKAGPDQSGDESPGLPRKISRRLDDELESTGNSEIDGITLLTDETVLEEELPLLSEIRTGGEFPYITSEKSALGDFDYQGDTSIMLLDESRLVLLLVSPPTLSFKGRGFMLISGSGRKGRDGRVSR